MMLCLEGNCEMKHMQLKAVNANYIGKTERTLFERTVIRKIALYLAT